MYVLKQLFILVLFVLGTASLAHAQAEPTAKRTADLQVGFGFANANTDYVPNRVNGETIYFTFDFTHRFGIEGSFRYLKDNPTNIYEKTYEIGGRYYHPIRPAYKLVPYAKLLYGRGVFNFATNGVTYANLAYNMIAGGAGLDYKLVRSVNLRADFEYQRWPSFPPHGLTPSVVTIGAAYHFH